MTTYPTQPTGDDIIDTLNIFAENNVSKTLMTTEEILDGYNNDGETITPLTSTPDGNKFNYFWYQVHNTLAWVVNYIKALYDNKLETSGGTLSGALAMGSNKITGLSDGTGANDAVNKSQLDVAIAGAMWLSEVKYLAYSTIPTLPSGMEVVYADGRALSRTTYLSLFSLIGTTYGSGDGSTTFNIPDMRGVVARGWDNGRGLDPTRGFGSYQEDTMQKITGSIALFGTEPSPAYDSGSLFTGTAPGYSAPHLGGSRNASIVTLDSSLQTRTSTETRMKNIALYPVIRIK